MGIEGETSADHPHFRVYGVRMPVGPAETALLADRLEELGSRFSLSAAQQIMVDLSHGRDVELGEPEALEALRALDGLAEAGMAAGGLGSLRAQLQAWRDLQ